MNLFISIDKKYKSESVIQEQIRTAKERADVEAGEILILVDSVEDADCAWFVDEWEDDIGCYHEHQYCEEHDIRILHDKSAFWNRTA